MDSGSLVALFGVGILVLGVVLMRRGSTRVDDDVPEDADDSEHHRGD